MIQNISISNFLFSRQKVELHCKRSAGQVCSGASASASSLAGLKLRHRKCWTDPVHRWFFLFSSSASSRPAPGTENVSQSVLAGSWQGEVVLDLPLPLPQDPFGCILQPSADKPNNPELLPSVEILTNFFHGEELLPQRTPVKVKRKRLIHNESPFFPFLSHGWFLDLLKQFYCLKNAL